jgi:hypothetical protein
VLFGGIVVSHSKCKCKSGHKVASWSERTIDDLLYEAGYQTIYEPEVPTPKGNFKADWLILPQNGLDKPVIIEYWGLLRKKNRARWVENRLPKYRARMKYKESIYQMLDSYHYVAIYPEDLENNLEERLLSKLKNLSSKKYEHIV